MITIKKKISLFTFTDVWFDYKFKWSDIFLPVCYRNIWNPDQRSFFCIKKKTTTIVLPLNKTIEEIHNNFSSDTKKAIRRAEAAGMYCRFHADAKGFIAFYNKFASSKKLYQLNLNMIPVLSGPEWSFSYAYFEDEVLAAHAYISDNKKGIVRALYGGSVRLNDSHTPKQIGNATKLLYYHDINYFKEKGLQYYDFGGWNNIPGLLEFKLSFGGAKKDAYNFFSFTYYLKDKLKELVSIIKPGS